MKDFQHTFLIRSPQQRMRSLVNGGHSPEEYDGFKELYELYNFVVDNLHPSTVVIDAMICWSSQMRLCVAIVKLLV